MEKLYAMYGDRVGRKRMNKDITLKKPYTARGLCIVTGENKPDVAQSRIARSLIIELTQNSIDLDKLSVLQNNSEQLSFAMKKYIRWIIDNEKILIPSLVNLFNNLRKNQDNKHHGRTNEIINVLQIGFSSFLQFMLENNIITSVDKQELEKTAQTVLTELVEEQSIELQDLQPSQLFYDAIEQLIASNQINLLDASKGWKFGDIQYTGEHVGFYDMQTKLYYFFPNIIYKNVIQFYEKQKKKFPLTENTLWKYLKEEGFLITNDPKRCKNKKTVTKTQYTVVQIKARTEQIHTLQTEGLLKHPIPIF